MVTHSQGVFQKDTLHDSQGKDVATVAVGGKKKNKSQSKYSQFLALVYSSFRPRSCRDRKAGTG